MSGPTKRLGVEVDERLWKRFRQDVRERKGRLRGQLSAELENAIQEYLEASKGGDIHDRLGRVEENTELLVDTLLLSQDNTHTHGSVAMGRLRKIRNQLKVQARDGRIKDEMIDDVITSIAGGDSRTIEKYRDMLKSKKWAIPDIRKENVLWYVDPEVYIDVVEREINPTDDVLLQLKDKYGRDWWAEHRPEKLKELDDDDSESPEPVDDRPAWKRAVADGGGDG